MYKGTLKRDKNGHKDSLQKSPRRPHVKADHQIHIIQWRYAVYNNE